MLVLLAALGAADAVVVSPPNPIATSGSSAYVSGQTVVWYDKNCVKAARLDRDAKVIATADVACGQDVRPAMIDGNLVVWTDKKMVAFGLLDAKLQFAMHATMHVNDGAFIVAIGWDGKRTWVAWEDQSRATVSLVPVDTRGMPGPITTVALPTDKALTEPGMHCGAGDCTLVLPRSDAPFLSIPIHDGQVGKLATAEEFHRPWPELAPVLGLRDLLPGLELDTPDHFAAAESPAGTLLAVEYGGETTLQLLHAGSGRHRVTELSSETNAALSWIDNDRFVCVAFHKNELRARAIDVKPARLPAEPARPAKLEIRVKPARKTHLGIDVVAGKSVEPIWERIADTDDQGTLVVDTVAGTAWINAWENGALGHARFQMVDVKPGETRAVELVLGERAQIDWPGAFTFNDATAEPRNIRAADINGLPTFVGADDQIHMQYLPPGKHVFVIADGVWRMTTTVEVGPGKDKDLTKLKFVADLEPGDIGVLLALDGGDTKLSGIVPGSPAERAKLAVGDVVVAIDGKPILGYLDAQARLYGAPGKPVELRVRSAAGKERRVSVVRAR